MNLEAKNAYALALLVEESLSGAFYFLIKNDWPFRETVPADCVGAYNSGRGFSVASDPVTLNLVWISCETW